MARFTLFLIAILVTSSVSIEIQKNESPSVPPAVLLTESGAPKELTDIPISDIIKDIHSGLSQPSESDLAGAESNPKRKIVGVKKNKNYEIVLYEYSDEEDVNALVDEFDPTEDGPRSRPKKGHKKPLKPSEDSDEDTHEDQRSRDPEKGPANAKPPHKTPNPTKEPPKSPSTQPPKGPKPSSQPPKPTQQPPRSTKPSTQPPKTSGPSRRPTKPTKGPVIDDPFSTDESPSPPRRSRPPLPDDEDDEFGIPFYEEDDEYDFPSRSTPFPFFREQPGRRRRPTTTSRLPTNSRNPTRRPRPGFDDDLFDDDEEEDPFNFRRQNERGPSTSRRPFNRRPSKPRRNETDDDLFDDDEEENPFNFRGQNERGPSRRPATRRPSKPRRNETDDDDEEEDPFFIRRPINATSRNSSRRPSKPRKDEVKSPRRFPEPALGAGRFKPTRRPIERQRNKTIADLEDDIDYDYDDPEAGPLCNDPTGKRGVCQEYFKCSVLYSNIAGRIDLQDYKCQLPSQVGICCPIVEERDTQGQRGRALMQMVKGRKALSRQIRKLIRSNVNNSIDFGTDSLAQLDEIENGLLTRSIKVDKNSAAASHNRFFPTSKKIRQVSDIGFELLQTTNDLSDRFQLTNEVGGLGLKSFKSSNIAALNDRCPSLPPCGINKYRKIDGSCNNLRKPKMGQSLTPLSRVLEPAYADGRWAPRESVRGFSLPSPRLLSETFIKDRDNPDNRYTLMVMQFGQFLDHDISSVPIFTFANTSGITCCRNGQFLPPELRHPNCMPIEIPRDDPFYSPFNQRCMNFVRSRLAPRIDCSLGYADQMNAVTHWIDLSNVYGSNEKEERELRLFQGGLMRFSELADRKPLLPLKRLTATERDLDYKAGDDRVNEMQGLMVMHLIWLREHNRIATELFRINPFWNDEQLFQESRRILTAVYQHIIYNEWLPIIIGRDYMKSYGILPLTRKGFFRGYDPEIDASIENAFSCAGFRMGHTLVQGIVRLINELGQDNEAVTISNHAENSERTRAPNQIDKWIRGLAQQPIQTFDPFVTRQLNGNLFKPRGGMFGMDLSSLNIQRSRDHGIPGYNSFRELCQTGKRAKRFEDFRDWIAPEIIEKMRRIYAHPDDVDLWIGGISETPLVGALIGPTFTCIVGDQFARSKKGDRYFYDLGDQTHSFSPDQLQEIRKASFARILCDNGDNLEAVQPSAFLQADFDFNSLVDCRRSSRIPRLNLRLWENEPTP